MSEYKTKVLIIGSGPAGYTAGIYAARARLSPIIVTGQQSGGQLTTTPEVENFPGFAQPISGLELMDNIRQQAINVGCHIIDDIITEVDFNHRPFICNSEKNSLYIGESIIIATGASAKWLNLESEQKYKGWGVSACASCDGFFYRDKKVAVIGGGNSAVEEALFLSNIASSVVLIHRRDELRADKRLQQRALENSRITILWDTVVEEILGIDNPLSVTGLKIKNIKNDTITTLYLDGVFVAIGHTPNTDVFRNYLDLDKQGYIKTAYAGSCQTNIEGIFAAGDVVAGNFKQAIIAAGSGCQAFLEAEKYLAQFK